VELGLHLPQMELGGEGQSLARLTRAAESARECGFAAVCANDHFLFQRPWLDGPTALAAVLGRTGSMDLATTVRGRPGIRLDRGAMGDRPENDSAEQIGQLGRAFAHALLMGDEVAAETVIREAMDSKLTTAEIDEQIIARALWLVGDLWQRGEISVADEHLATEISIRVLALQREAQRVVRTRGGRRVMLATPSGELHVVALRMADNLLREAGFDVYMLGADVPPHAIAGSARRYQPDVIGLSSTMPGGGDQILITIHEVQKAWPGARYVLGGRGLTSRLETVPGMDVCGSVSDVVPAVDALVHRADMN
jgi:methanogenic corrinoid protein MtbC1